MASTSNLPLDGIKVIEFTHMVMGPTVGVIFADLGADVIKVEPIKGDATRKLKGSGAGYFSMYNRNKKSICLNLKDPDGNKIAKELCNRMDVVIENFRPGTIERLGLGYADLSKDNPRLIFCHAKGFLNGPYENRTALDEVAQMMGGLAYMTGPPGRPLRAGASVIDVTGGMFGCIAVMAALEQRHRTGKGQEITTSLFETTAFLVGQHMAQYAVTGTPAPPMPARVSAWAIYDVFETGDDSQIFVGVVSDGQWTNFCEAFELTEFSSDRSLDENNARVAERDRILPVIRDLFKQYDKQTLMAKLEEMGMPFAPISKPEELFDDPHLAAGGGLIPVTIPNNGKKTKLPALPIEMDGRRFGTRIDLPQPGEHGRDILKDMGYTDDQIDGLMADGVVGCERPNAVISVE
ncbi:MAG: CoA transferase [Alphaproteobacteria bacterium]|nr:MAG: CoA transferase [Alphaproteobacteria bacterium]